MKTTSGYSKARKSITQPFEKSLRWKKNNWNIFSYLLLAFQIAILILQGSVLEFYEIRRFYFLFHWKLDKCVSYQQLEKETCFGNDRHKNTLPLETIENFNFSFYIQTKTAEFGLSSSILSIRDMVLERCNRQYGRETIHPTKKKLLLWICCKCLAW